jgi:hypothetical protein
MSVPLKVQLFDAFLGSAEGIHSLIMPDVFSSGGSMNLCIDKYGRAKKIGGYAKLNNTATTTDTGASAGRIRGLFQYKTTGGGTTTRRLIKNLDDATNEWELWYSTDGGATWTFLYDAGAASINRIPDFAQFGDDLYICNGVIAPRKLSGVSIAAAGQTQSPTPSSAVSASVGNPIGTYKYKLVSMASGVRQAGSTSSTALAVQNKQVSLSWTADTNVAVTGYEVYRTTGTGSVFYFVSYVDLRVTAAFTDNVDDLTILQNRILEEHGDAPPSGAYFCEPHKQRMWYFRTDTYPTRGWFSDAGNAESVLTTSNYIDFSDAETVGDVLVGSFGNFEGQLVVFSERAVWVISGTGQIIGNIVDWTRTRTNAQTGSVTHRSAVRVPAGSKYADQNGELQQTRTDTIAYWTPLGDIRLFDGDNDLVISHPVQTTVQAFSYSNRAKINAVHDTQRGEVTWMFPSTAASEPDGAVTWNYRYGVWYKRSWPFACAIEADDASHASVLIGGSASTTTGGYVYQLWSGTSFDGSAIQSQWMTKTLYGVNEQGQPAMSARKRFRWADFLFETEQTTSLTVEWLQGNTPDNAAAFGSTTIAPSASHILTSTGDRLTTASGDPLTVAVASSQARALLQSSAGRYLHDEGIRLRIGDNASSGSWALEGMNLAYQILPGLERRMP